MSQEADHTYQVGDYVDVIAGKFKDTNNCQITHVTAAMITITQDGEDHRISKASVKPAASPPAAAEQAAAPAPAPEATPAPEAAAAPSETPAPAPAAAQEEAASPAPAAEAMTEDAPQEAKEGAAEAKEGADAEAKAEPAEEKKDEFPDPDPRRRQGEVATWQIDRGFGFVKPDEADSEEVKEQIFCHNTALRGSVFHQLAAGDKIEYTLERDPKNKSRLRASDVTGPGGEEFPSPWGEKTFKTGVVRSWNKDRGFGFITPDVPEEKNEDKKEENDEAKMEDGAAVAKEEEKKEGEETKEGEVKETKEGEAKEEQEGEVKEAKEGEATEAKQEATEAKDGEATEAKDGEATEAKDGEATEAKDGEAKADEAAKEGEEKMETDAQPEGRKPLPPRPADDIFVHHTALFTTSARGAFLSIADGTKVEYTTTLDPKGKTRADKVTLEGHHPILGAPGGGARGGRGRGPPRGGGRGFSPYPTSGHVYGQNYGYGGFAEFSGGHYPQQGYGAPRGGPRGGGRGGRGRGW
eukprot:NODE_863_length_1731_cov_383.478002_g69_i1.p1 GENE.NODE_863_length_1731_cov_383.478002_g69_i1~~NODE_863_length_1731_cov_383.478002_g69_i1.p1  ORF type:complete len:546 (-),score=191.56 NODE_863_length_1731_cov_383.478002_g69_i1:93-1664(-)